MAKRPDNDDLPLAFLKKMARLVVVEGIPECSITGAVTENTLPNSDAFRIVSDRACFGHPNIESPAT
jgi:hypothetical protein